MSGAEMGAGAGAPREPAYPLEIYNRPEAAEDSDQEDEANAEEATGKAEERAEKKVTWRDRAEAAVRPEAAVRGAASVRMRREASSAPSNEDIGPNSEDVIKSSDGTEYRLSAAATAADEDDDGAPVFLRGGTRVARRHRNIATRDTSAASASASSLHKEGLAEIMKQHRVRIIIRGNSDSDSSADHAIIEYR
jgi:hypothetical protein